MGYSAWNDNPPRRLPEVVENWVGGGQYWKGGGTVGGEETIMHTSVDTA